MRKKVIVQDADPDLLETMVLVLEEAGYEAIAIRQYDEVMPRIGALQPALVLVDFKMDGAGSIRLCHEIKQHYPRMPVIALSCNSNIDREYQKAGFDDFLCKPFDIHLLVQLLLRYIR